MPHMRVQDIGPCARDRLQMAHCGWLGGVIPRGLKPTNLGLQIM